VRSLPSTPLALLLLLLLGACAGPAAPPPAPPAEPVRPAPSEEARAEAGTLFAEAKRHMEDQRYATARATLERAARLDPTHAEAQVLLAELYWRDARWDDAVKAAEVGRDADPTNIAAHRGLALYYAGLGLDAEADAAARRWIELGPVELEEWQSIADIGYERRNYPLCLAGAEGALRVVEETDPKLLSDEAKTLYADMRRSRAVCSELLRLAPAPAEGAAEAEAGADPAAAVRARRVRKQVLDGARLLAQRRFTAAASVLERALAIAPDDPDALVRLADARWRGGRRDEAVQTAERALEIEPTNTIAVSALATYQRELEHWNESETYHRRFAELAPGDPWPWNGLGLVGYSSANWALCIEGYERALAETAKVEARLLSEQAQDEQAEARDKLRSCRAKRR
jgi:tetratricopeptide (TPR) repeat protein